MDRFTKSCLVLIALFLAMIALRPFFAPQPAYAARYSQYDLFYEPASRLALFQSDFAPRAASGWDVVAVTYVPSYGSNEGGIDLILGK
jgi:hypothetical protein